MTDTLKETPSVNVPEQEAGSFDDEQSQNTMYESDVEKHFKSGTLIYLLVTRKT